MKFLNFSLMLMFAFSNGILGMLVNLLSVYKYMYYKCSLVEILVPKRHFLGFGLEHSIFIGL